jgi:hypothetical protein
LENLQKKNKVFLETTLFYFTPILRWTIINPWI